MQKVAGSSPVFRSDRRPFLFRKGLLLFVPAAVVDDRSPAASARSRTASGILERTCAGRQECKGDLTLVVLTRRFGGHLSSRLAMAHHSHSEESTGWPYSSLLFLGYFGPNYPGGRALAFRATLALIAFVIGVLMIQAGGGLIVHAIGGLMVVGSITALVYSNARYLSGLDELSRRIQLEAFSWTYAVAFFVMAMLLVVGRGTLSMNPLFLVFLEPVRGAVLVLVARKYR
jgi:hypothetical protein